MKKRSILIVGLLLTAALAWTAIAQPPAGGRGGFGRMREAQQNALTALQEQIAKFKAMMEQPRPQRNFQDMTQEERAKLREEFMKRREERLAIMNAMEQQIDTLKGSMQLAMEHRHATMQLEEILGSAKSENATATVAKIEKLMADRQKEFDDRITAIGLDPEWMQQMMERMNQMGQRRGPQ